MGDTRDTRAELAGREGLALLFLAEEGWETHGTPELSWRIGRGWPRETHGIPELSWRAGWRKRRTRTRRGGEERRTLD